MEERVEGRASRIGDLPCPGLAGYPGSRKLQGPEEVGVGHTLALPLGCQGCREVQQQTHNSTQGERSTWNL